MLKSAILYVFFALVIFQANAQNDVLNTRISLKIKKQSMVEILNAIEAKAGVTFNYNSKIIPPGLYNINAKDEELSNVLVQLLKPHKLGFSILYGKNIVISKQEKKISRYTISGYVNDEYTGEKLIGVSIHSRKGTETCLSNQDGFYSLTMFSDSIQLVFEMPGYQNKVMGFKLGNNLVLNVQLKDEISELRYTVSSKIDGRSYQRFKDTFSHGRKRTMMDAYEGLQTLVSKPGSPKKIATKHLVAEIKERTTVKQK